MWSLMLSVASCGNGVLMSGFRNIYRLSHNHPAIATDNAISRKTWLAQKRIVYLARPKWLLL